MFNKKIMKQGKIFSRKVLLKLNRQKLKLFSDTNFLETPEWSHLNYHGHIFSRNGNYYENL